MWGATDFRAARQGSALGPRPFDRSQRRLIDLICRENGKPRLEALVEITYVCDALTFIQNRRDAFCNPIE